MVTLEDAEWTDYFVVINYIAICVQRLIVFLCLPFSFTFTFLLLGWVQKTSQGQFVISLMIVMICQRG